MTPRGRVLSAAVICTAFLIGCQEQGSNPVGPEDLGPQFGHKPKHNPGGGGGGGPTPAEATFGDASGDRVLSDDGNSYVNSGGVPPCVIARVEDTGMFFLRTTGGNCFATTGGFKPIVLDFGDAISRSPDGSGSDGCHVDDANGHAGELNICGLNTISDVRVIARDLFSKNGLRRGTRVGLAFSLEPDFQNTDFSLEFEQRLDASGDAVTRTFAAGASSVAVLQKGQTVLGRFNMPFSLQVAKQ